MKASAALLFTACVVLAPLALAQETTPQFKEIAPPPPVDTIPVPDAGDDLDAEASGPEPDVTIVKRKDAEIEEYRLNGRLYMVKVKPFVGPAYYIVDRDGDGLMESRINGRLDDEPRPPQWVILSW